MSIALTMRVKALEDFRRKLEEAKPGEVVIVPQGIDPRAIMPAPQPSIEERLKALENKYHMLNARLNKKNNNGENPDQQRDHRKT